MTTTEENANVTEADLSGIFGDMDVMDISDNPWGVANDTYWCKVIEAYNQVKDNGQVYFVIKWQINEPDNEFHGNPIRDSHPRYPGKTFAELNPDEKKKTKYLMRRMVRAFDLSKEEIGKTKPSDLLGKEAYVTTKVNDTFINVTDAVSKRLFEELGGFVNSDTTSTSASLGM